jgi:hypothetical protein
MSHNLEDVEVGNQKYCGYSIGDSRKKYERKGPEWELVPKKREQLYKTKLIKLEC